MPVERRPQSPVPLNLPNGGKPHPVKDDETWETVAEQYGLLPLELVYFNFKTFDSDEVNWYLRHYVGCTKPTRDGLNWRFSSGLDKGKSKRLPGQREWGVVYIPPETVSFDDPDVIGLKRPPRYFRVRVHPKDWSPPFWMQKKWNKGEEPPKYGTYERAAKNVVTMIPWQRQSFSINGVPIISRKGWNAHDPAWANEVVYYNRISYPLFEMLDTIVVHHTDNNDPIGEVEADQKKRRYAAIGYHFFIDRKGVIHEGRPLEIMGSNAGEGKKDGPMKDAVLDDPDWGKIGIVLQGDYQHPTNVMSREGLSILETQLQSLEKLIVAIQKSYRIKRLLMHREVPGRVGDPTDCPGNLAVPHIVKLRKKLGLPGL
jgi:N-acetylmuramoyl-L-alanine amidase